MNTCQKLALQHNQKVLLHYLAAYVASQGAYCGCVTLQQHPLLIVLFQTQRIACCFFLLRLHCSPIKLLQNSLNVPSACPRCQFVHLLQPQLLPFASDRVVVRSPRNQKADDAPKPRLLTLFMYTPSKAQRPHDHY
eukprot:TRINITY_DN1165_c0_g1_i6.p2 TRINITY_DN1165_c0_g1~~TRINITY_DN1165_c0_g1_i6.p2  ORF type:complete len:136 (+),score=0.03 TRINITY_DN1165_c0_g1_i6:272-679(+)